MANLSPWSCPSGKHYRKTNQNRPPIRYSRLTALPRTAVLSRTAAPTLKRALRLASYQTDQASLSAAVMKSRTTAHSLLLGLTVATGVLAYQLNSYLIHQTKVHSLSIKGFIVFLLSVGAALNQRRFLL